MLGWNLPKIPNILRSQLSEEERQEAREEGLREGQELAIEADKQRRQGESISDAMERMRRSRR